MFIVLDEPWSVRECRHIRCLTLGVRRSLYAVAARNIDQRHGCSSSAHDGRHVREFRVMVESLPTVTGSETRNTAAVPIKAEVFVRMKRS